MWVLWATVNNILWCYAMEDDCCANVEELSHIWAGLDVPYVPRYHTSDYQLADWAKYLIRSKTFFFFFFKWPCFSKSTFQTIFRSRSLDETYFSQSHTQLCKWWQLIVPKTGLEMTAEKKISQTTFMDFSFSLAWFTVWWRFFKLMMKSTDKERRLFLHIEFRTHLNSVVLVKTGNMKCHRKKTNKNALNRLISCHKLSRVSC